MPRVNLSGMTVDALMDLREQRLTNYCLSVVPKFNSSWRGWVRQLLAQGLFDGVEAH